MESLLCPFDKSKYYCVDVAGSLANAVPGMILYSDGTVSENVVSSKTPVGVVAYNDGKYRLAISLQGTDARWAWNGSDGKEVDISCLPNIEDKTDALNDMDGKNNTECIISSNTGYKHPAAEYCNSYKPVSSGTGASGWYLPAAGELYNILHSRNAVNIGLQKVGTEIPSNYDDDYWSSTEQKPFQEGSVWTVSVKSFDMDDGYLKSNSFRTRCVLAF